MALPATCSLTSEDYNDGISSQNPILRNEIIRFIALNDPYSNIFDGGTTQSNAGDTIQTVVTGRVVTNQSLVQPVFDAAIDSCGITGEASEFGQTKFTTFLENMRGKGPTICVKQARNSVIESFNIAGQNLKDGIKSLMSADNRNQLLVKSGVKAVLYSNATNLSQILTGGYNEVSVAFKGGVPTASVSHKFLVTLCNYMRDNLSPEFFGDGAGQYFVFISSSDQTEALRNQAGLKQELLAYVTGNDKGVGDALKKYAFIDYPYRGIKLAIDQQPLRFNTVDGAGFPVLIEPLVRTATNLTGVQNLTNPTWVSAQYEVGFLVSKGAFRRLVPERYVGESSFKWEPQFTMGELLWRNIIDNQCNPFGDFGYHIYQIERAIQARRPHGVIPVLYKRCAADLGLGDGTCTQITDTTL